MVIYVNRNPVQNMSLITGGAGFVGHHSLKRLLSTNEYNITVIDNNIRNTNDSSKNNYPILPLQTISLYEIDIRDGTLFAIFSKRKI